MLKSEVEERPLGDFGVMPQGVEASFKTWWRGLLPASKVEVRYPHERHGNAGRVSNSAKAGTREQFLQFVDLNTQPKGRSADSTGPTMYFIPKFSTIQTPKHTVSHYEQRVSRWWANSTEFNVKWEGRKLLMDAPITGLKLSVRKEPFLSHLEDNCDTCAKSKATITAKQTTINRLRQSAQASPEEIMKLEDEVKTLRQENETHRGEANQSHAYHVEVTKRCSSELATQNGLRSLLWSRRQH